MSLDSILSFAIPAVALVVLLLVIGIILAKLYVKTSTDTAFVRTGGGKSKVVMNGGAVVFPVIHSLTWVNLRTLKLRVERKERNSLVTGDYLRADVDVDFHVRVGADVSAVLSAAQTLGNLTREIDAMKELIEPKLVDVLRAVAATMDLDQLHQQRAAFVQKVREAVAPVLEQNGLVLESVSLTGLGQTDKRFYDLQNVMDAQGAAKMTRTIEESRKQINDVEQTNAVAIEQRNLEAAKQRAEIKRSQTDVELANQQEIARMTADRQAEIAATTAEGQRKEQLATIAAEQAVALERTASHQKTRQAELEATRALQESEAATDRAVREARVAADAAVKLQEQEKSTEVKLRAQEQATQMRLKEQAQAIEVAGKAREEAAARAAADKARAEAVAEEERVITAREVEVAERAKRVAVVAAEKVAQENSIGVVVAAKAELEAAENRATALRVAAEADRDAARSRAEGALAEGEAAAKSKELDIAAENLLSAEVQALRKSLALIQMLPEAIRESVANVGDVRITHVGGLTGAGGGSGGDGATNPANPVQSVVNGALAFRAQAPLIDGLVAEVTGQPGARLQDLLSGTVAGANLTPAVQTAVPSSAASATASGRKGGAPRD